MSRPPLRSFTAALLASLLLSACNTPPAAPPPPVVAPARDTAQALHDLGFARSDEGWELNLSGQVVFDVNDANLSEQALASIARIASTLREIGVRRITVQGHTDNQGSASFNQALSERRAESAAKAFVAQGFGAADITRKGYGFSRPIADNATEAGRQLNRRVTVIVSSL